ncbi:MAG: DUF2785 domain-containing protein [Rhodoferax sp.]|nr:DUF2785 domain-containing protein [Rhodoferax sp.]
MLLRSLRLLTFGTLALASLARAQTCPPAQTDIAALRALKTAQWKLEDAAKREALAVALIPCLASPNPELRDGIAFEALSTWLRSKQLSAATQQTLFQRLLTQLQSEAHDTDGFARPFATLALSEVARADRVTPFLSIEERASLVSTAVMYLQGVKDYRGFAAGEGWRHGVAHGADLLMQLALNPAVDKGQLERMVTAVQTQIAPISGHSYIFGESERLARPVLYAARRGLLDAAWWQAWVQAVVSPAPLSAWDAAFESTAGLSRLHNTKAFLLALYVNVQESRNEVLLSTLLPPVRDALLKLP